MTINGSSSSSDAVPTGVGRTALMVAAMRAAETRRADRLFEDPYADDFLEASGGDPFGSENAGGGDGFADIWSNFANYAPIRTRFFDEYLRDATRGIRQVVIVAAGLDTRAFRLGWPSDVTVYELDSAEVLGFKQRVLDGRSAKPEGRRVAVAVDLREEWGPALLAAGFDPGEPSAWLVEGLVSYLTPEQNDRLLGAISALAVAGSRISVEYLHVDAVALMGRAMSAAAGSDVESMWTGCGIGEASGAWLDRFGWDSEAFDAFERATAYGRELPPLGDTPIDRFTAAARNGFVIARRR
ncbi:SAM-dependent methyltransferase [Nocardia sp. NPDC088792]|uniref:SAM-dependent methyltransferase n=1 Tax=Nocardia sp. NPDC088792 TaxID=3364332 RepID=UPI00381CD3BE